MHVPWCMPGSLTRVSFEVGGGENVPGIPGACATRNLTYLVRCSCKWAVRNPGVREIIHWYGFQYVCHLVHSVYLENARQWRNMRCGSNSSINVKWYHLACSYMNRSVNLVTSVVRHYVLGCVASYSRRTCFSFQNACIYMSLFDVTSHVMNDFMHWLWSITNVLHNLVHRTVNETENIFFFWFSLLFYST